MRTATARPLNPKQLRTVARALPALLESDAVIAAAAQGQQKVLAALEGELKLKLSCTARLLDAPIAARPSSLRHGCCFVVLSLFSTGQRVILELEEGFAAALVDPLAGGDATAFAPGELTRAEVAALGFLTLVSLRALRTVELIECELADRLFGICRTRAEAESALDGEQSLLGVDLQLTLGAISGGARLLLPSRVVERLVSVTRAVESAALSESFAAHTLPALALMGSAELSPEELSGLAIGDVVLFGGVTRAGDSLEGPTRLCFDSFHLRGAFDGRAFTLAPDGVSTTTEDAMSTPPPPPLPIELEIELSRIRIPLSQLSSLKPGAILGLDVSLNEPVTLRVGGRAVATAELVDLEGEVGARILSLIP